METVELAYHDGSTYQTRNYNAYRVKGIGTPDAVQFLTIQHRLKNGGFAEYIKNFNLVITLQLEVIQDIEDATFLWEFYRRQTRRVIYDGYYSFVEPHGDMALVAEWLENCELGRAYTLRLVDVRAYTAFPSRNIGDRMYFTYKVKIEGTQASPETFTTGSGKLATTARGTAYPTFDSGTQSVHVEVNGAPYQDGKINIVTQASISGGNVTFTAAVSDAGNPSSDGFFYADIAFYIQEDE